MLRSPFLHFLLIGALLFAVQSIRSPRVDVPVIEVRRSEVLERLDAYRQQMGRPPTDSEARAIENQVIENALWLEQAFALHLHEVDSVVRQRLLMNMRFLDGTTARATRDDAETSDASDTSDTSDTSEAELIERAIALGMDRSDTVVKRRLIDRVQAIVRAGVRSQPISEETIAAHYDETKERWREPALLDLSHVYFSRDKRGDETRADAARTLLVLSESEHPDDVEAAIALGDPFLAGHRLRGATPNRIIARLGPVFAEGVADAQPGAWIGPVESAFGQHLVLVHDRIESRIPPLDEIRTRVVEDWIEQTSREALREYIASRRTQVDLRMIDDVAHIDPIDPIDPIDQRGTRSGDEGGSAGG